MLSKERVAVYVDGSNFYHYLKDKEVSFPRGVKFDFKAFVDFLANNRECISKRYYTGIFRNVDNSEKSMLLIKGQQKFLTKIEKDGTFSFLKCMACGARHPIKAKI